MCIYDNDNSSSIQSVVKRSPVTTHVLDTARGRPAGQLPVSIALLSADGQWVVQGSG